jgi:excisionase family DNA binding protein
MTYEELPELISPKLLAEYLGLSYKTVLRIIREKRIVSCNVGSRKYVVHKYDLAVYLGFNTV